MIKTCRKNKKNKTHRIYKKKGGNQTTSNSTGTKKCINTFIKNKSKKYLEKTKELKKMLEKEARSKFKNDKPKLKESLKRIKDFTSFNPETKKIIKNADIKIYCNPSCEGTILEPGNKLSERYYSDYKSNKKLVKLFEEQRKKIFGKKTNVLVDGFYENAPKKYLEEIKKQGAISLCSPIIK
jgi:hypothetical protein